MLYPTGARAFPTGPQYGDYEFNAYENSIIDKTASRAKLWGTISTVIGVLQILGSCGMLSNPVLSTYLRQESSRSSSALPSSAPATR
jgi:hypothetical protein